MKRLRYIVLIALLAVSCTKQEMAEQPCQNMVRTRITAVTSDSKINITQQGVVSWTDTDELSVFTDTDVEDGQTNYCFKITDPIDGGKASFEGEVVENPARRRVYMMYPYRERYQSYAPLFKSGGDVSVGDFSSGTDCSSMLVSIPVIQDDSKAASYTMMWASAAVEGSDFSGVHAHMKHLTLLWDVTVSNPERHKIESVTLKASDRIFPIQEVLDMTDEDASASAVNWSDSLQVKFSFLRNATSISARFVLLPVTACASAKIDVKVRYYDGACEYFHYNGFKQDMKPGCRYSNTVVLGEGEYHDSVEEGYYYGPAFAHVPSLDKMKVYEASPRVFASNKSLNVIKSRLDKISALGVNVLWIMPIFETSTVRKPQGSPYSLKSFWNIDPEYGTLQDLRDLVSAAHSKGIAVILDFVTNHSGADCPWVLEHPSWYMQQYSPSYTDAALFDWRNSELQDEMIKIMKYWIQTANIDGYRCDTAMPNRTEGVSLAFWKRASEQLKGLQDGRNVIMLAEAAQPVCLDYGFDLNYGWHYCDALGMLLGGTMSVSTFFSTDQDEWNSQASNPGKTRMRHSTNHDRSASAPVQETYKSQAGADAAFVLALTMGGVPMIYSSQEIGYDGRISIFKGSAPVMNWNSNPEIYARYCNLMTLADNEVIRKGTTVKITNTNVVSFMRRYQGKDVLVLVNIRGSQSSYSLSTEVKSAQYKNLLTGEPYTFTTTSLSPYEYLILEKQ